MQISGLQKLSLIDYPGKVACTIFLFGCNFRCGFCHNPHLVLPEKENHPFFVEEVLDFLDKRKKYLDAVCITGGEPLLSDSIISFVERIKEKGYAVKIDTNGSNPDLLKELLRRKLVDYVAVDIKSDKDNYYSLTNSEINLGKIEESICWIIDSGVDYEFRTTCIPGVHTEEIISNIGKWLFEVIMKKPKKYFLQGFVSRNDLLDEKFSNVGNASEDFLNKLKFVAENYFESVGVR